MSQLKRSRGRDLALQALCLFDALGEGFAGDVEGFLRDPVHYADLGWTDRPESETIRFARTLALGAWHHRERADELLRKSVVEWSIERMQPVDRNILRLGLYELLECPETPFAVALNEAIELAHRFGSAESPGFVNGVLDHLRRDLSIVADEPPAPTAP